LHSYYECGFAPVSDIKIAFDYVDFVDGRMTFKPSRFSRGYYLAVATAAYAFLVMSIIVILWSVYETLGQSFFDSLKAYITAFLPMALTLVFAYQHRDLFFADKLWKREKEWLEKQAEI